MSSHTPGHPGYCRVCDKPVWFSAGICRACEKKVRINAAAYCARQEEEYILAEKIRWNSLTPQQQQVELIQKQNALLSSIQSEISLSNRIASAPRTVKVRSKSRLGLGIGFLIK